MAAAEVAKDAEVCHPAIHAYCWLRHALLQQLLPQPVRAATAAVLQLQRRLATLPHSAGASRPLSERAEPPA
jgi:hypothetical protein